MTLDVDVNALRCTTPLTPCQLELPPVPNEKDKMMDELLKNVLTNLCFCECLYLSENIRSGLYR